MRRLYFPSDFAGLSADERHELEELQCTRAEYDAMRKQIAYGDCCAALIHLRRAETLLRTADAEMARQLLPIAAQLGALIPSYIHASILQPTKPTSRQ